jgi:hypothetical protein
VDQWHWCRPAIQGAQPLPLAAATNTTFSLTSLFVLLAKPSACHHPFCLPPLTEYVWIGGTGADLRSKARTLAKVPTKPEELPHWNYDGSSTGQAPGTDSEVYLIPRAIFK